MTQSIDVVIPNIGGAKGSKVIDVLVKVGDKVAVDAPLLTLESDKASMDIPAPHSGTVEVLLVKEGAKVSEGDKIITLKVEKEAENAKDTKVTEDASSEDVVVQKDKTLNHGDVYASPFVRRLAFEMSIDLKNVSASGAGNRVTLEDIKAFIQQSSVAATVVDYGKWGKIAEKEMSGIQSASAKHITQAWQSIPQVTQHHWADITELEKVRKSYKTKITVISFVMKAMADIMAEMEPFRRGWGGDKFIVRDYYHIGFAVETPKGLLVPVCKDVDKQSVQALAKHIAAESEKARTGKSKAEDMEGRVATISSLGGIGGGHFTPIVTAPDSFMIGLGRAEYRPVYQNEKLHWRYMMPFSLSYDHRLIDGADGARFVVALAKKLEAIKK